MYIALENTHRDVDSMRTGRGVTICISRIKGKALLIFSRRDSIALPVAAIVGVVFAYLTVQAGFVGVFIFVFYSLIIIPLIMHFLAQGKLLVWQVCTLSFVAYIIAKNASLGGFAIGDALQEFHVIWGLETVLSLPLPAYYYFHRAKQRKSYRVELFLPACCSSDC